MKAIEVITITTKTLKDEMKKIQKIMDDPSLSSLSHAHHRGYILGTERAIEVLKILNGGKEVD